MKEPVVIIGRNEGERLRRSFESVAAGDGTVVYVDSASTDGSVELARSFGADVVELDMSLPFTAARARNAGFRRALEINPDTQYVQFLDGDCELAGGWLEKASEVLNTRPEVAIVCGRLREQGPDRSIYNRLCDMEWNTATGEVDACGGIFMVRVDAFREAGGFDTTIVAGEEPELCLRLRQKAWKILRIDAEMARHDAAMTRFSQWWRRCVRAGAAYAQGAALHGGKPERHYVREVRSALFWGGALPGIMLASLAAGVGHPAALLVAALGACGYGVLAWRIYRWRRTFADPPRHALLYTAFCILAKLPQCRGIIVYAWRRMRGRKQTLIEYKSTNEKSAKGVYPDDEQETDRSQSQQCPQVHRSPNA